MTLNFARASSQQVSLGANLAHIQNVAETTISAWAQPTTGALNMSINSWQEGLFTNTRLSLFLNVNWQGFGTRSDSGGNVGSVVGSLVAANQLVHAAIVCFWTAQRFDLYLNGLLNATAAPAGWTANTPNTPSISARIGARFSGTNTFDGPLSDVRIYQRALSAAEISDLFLLRGRDTNYQNLASRWKLDEGAPGVVASGAGSVKDNGPFQTNGTPSNSPTYQTLTTYPRRRAA